MRSWFWCVQRYDVIRGSLQGPTSHGRALGFAGLGEGFAGNGLSGAERPIPDRDVRGKPSRGRGSGAARPAGVSAFGLLVRGMFCRDPFCRVFWRLRFHVGRLLPGLGDGMGGSGGASADGSDEVSYCVRGDGAEGLTGANGGMWLSVGILYYSSRPILEI